MCQTNKAALNRQVNTASVSPNRPSCSTWANVAYIAPAANAPVRDIQQRMGITTLFVTHGQDEALSMADRIVVMRDGHIEQVAAPDMLYREPATPFALRAMGPSTLPPSQRGARSMTSGWPKLRQHG